MKTNKKIKNPSFKEIHKKPGRRWNKQVLQNKPISFRPTDKQAIMFRELKDIAKTSELIRKSIDFRQEFLEDPEKFFILWGRKMGMQFKQANRKLGRERKEGKIIYGK